jgi:hypothetical protein
LIEKIGQDKKNNMKNTILNSGKVFGVLVLYCTLAACPSKEMATDNNSDKKPIDRRHTVEIKFTETSSYCGGAAPPQELLDQLATPQPISGIEYFIKLGTTNKLSDPVVTTGRADQNGIVHLLLNEGDYYLVFAEKKDDKHYNELFEKYKNGDSNHEPINKTCLDTWLATPDYAFTVKNDAANIHSHNIHKPCSWNAIPCVTYTGPYPP